MNKLTRKYLAEFGLNMVSGPCVLAQQNDLDDLHEFFGGAVPAFHIYMICTRPRITFDTSVFHVDTEFISGRFFVQRGTTFEIHDYKTPNSLHRIDISLQCPYPHNFATLCTSDGKVVSGGKAALLVSYFESEFIPLLDLNIEYIGQAFGDTGERLAPERLGSHSTLQAIYADVLEKRPDQDVWITLWEFDPVLITIMGGNGILSAQTTTQECDEHIENVMNAEIPKQQIVNLTEAALIKYFQPSYNTQFKNKFPHPNHSSYKECYELDLNTIFVEVQSYKLRCRLCSAAIQPNWLHIAQFPLHSREQRQAMFDFLSEST